MPIDPKVDQREQRERRERERSPHQVETLAVGWTRARKYMVQMRTKTKVVFERTDRPRRTGFGFSQAHFLSYRLFYGVLAILTISF